MDIFTFEKLIVFIIFFIPGFISIKTYCLMVANGNIKFSEALAESVAYSSINYAAFSWLLILMFKYETYKYNLVLFVVLMLLIMFVTPILWPFLYLRLSRLKAYSKYFLNPNKLPWDFYFSKKEPCWVIIRLKNGQSIAGVYNSKSFTSEFPNEAQIYLEELWDLDNNGNFSKKIERTKGVIVFCSEMLTIEFYK